MGVFGHGYTYSGHPLACAVANKVLQIYERDGVYAHANRVGAYLQSRLASFADHPLVGEVSGRGLIAALELVANKASKAAFEGTAIGAYCAKAAEKAGLIVRAVGANRVALCPPLIITEEQVDELIEKLAVALEETLAYVKAEGLLVD